MPESKEIYFLSDFHLGAPDYSASLQREKKIVAFLDSIRHNAAEIFIVGDIFDFGMNTKKWCQGAMFVCWENLRS